MTRLCFKPYASGGHKENKMSRSLRLYLVWTATKEPFSFAGTKPIEKVGKSHQRKGFFLYILKTDYIYHEDCTKIASDGTAAVFQQKSRR